MKRSRGAIPRKKLNGRHVQQVVNDFSEITGYTYTPFELKQCTAQPLVGDDLINAVEGYDSKSVYTVYTETKVTQGKQGTNIKPDEIQINGEWYRVIKVKAWQVGVIPHYEVTCVEIDEGLA